MHQHFSERCVDLAGFIVKALYLSNDILDWTLIRGVRLPYPPVRAEIVVGFLCLFLRNDRDLSLNGFPLHERLRQRPNVFLRDEVLGSSFPHVFARVHQYDPTLPRRGFAF